MKRMVDYPCWCNPAGVPCETVNLTRATRYHQKRRLAWLADLRNLNNQPKGQTMTHEDERSCTAHIHDDPIEAEWTTATNGLTYIVLRCTICNRPQGLRLIRKSDPRHPNNQAVPVAPGYFDDMPELSDDETAEDIEGFLATIDDRPDKA